MVRSPIATPDLIRAVIQAESGGNPRAVSPTGARGLMQIQPETARNPGFGLRAVDPDALWDEAANVDFGTQYLNAMLARYDGDAEAALVAYNAGPGNADKWVRAGRNWDALPKPQETRPYVEKVMAGAKAPVARPVQDPAIIERLNKAAGGSRATPPPPNLRPVEDAEILNRLNQTYRAGEQSQGAEQPAPDPASPMGALAVDAGNQIGAAMQGTSPILRGMDGKANYEEVGPLVETDYGVGAQGPDGFVLLQNILPDGRKVDAPGASQNFVVLTDPADGRVKVYRRSEATNEGAASAAGRMLMLGVAGNAPAGIARSMTAERAVGATTPRAQVLQELERVGVTPSPSDMGGVAGPASQSVGNALRKTILGGVVDRRIDARATQTGQAAERIAGQMGAARTADEAGEGVLTGLDRWAKDAGAGDSFKAQSDALYANVERYVDRAAPVDTTNTQEAIARIVGRYDDPALAQDRAPDAVLVIQDAIERAGGRLSWNDLKQLRTDLGYMNASTTAKNRLQKSQLNELYAALSDDIMAGTRTMGGEEGARALRIADRYYADGMERLKSLQKITGAQTNEAAFGRIMQWMGKGNSANIDGVKALRQSLRPSEWNDLAATVLRRMGQETPGAAGVEAGFSINTFLTNWNKLDDAAKGQLFAHANQDTRRALDSLVRVASRQKDMERGRNVSGSGTVLTTAMLGGTVAVDTALAGALAAGGLATSALITSPIFARWLVKAQNLAKANNVAALTKHAGRLSTIGEQLGRAEATNAIRQELLMQLRQGGAQAPTGPAAGSSPMLQSPAR